MKETQKEPVLVAQSVLAALAFIFGGISTMAASSHNDTLAMIGGLGTLLTGGANLGVGYFVRGQVTPNGNVAAYRDASGDIVAGDAIPTPTGAPVSVEGTNAA